MNSRLYIDGLLASIGEQELTDMFSTFGNVLSVDVYPSGTALSSGIGVVEMANLGDAAKAISALHRSYWGGKLLLVFHAPGATKTLQHVETFPESVALSLQLASVPSEEEAEAAGYHRAGNSVSYDVVSVCDTERATTEGLLITC